MGMLLSLPVEGNPFFFFFSECVPVCLVRLCIRVTAHVEVRENSSGVEHSYCEFWEANSNPGAALQALLSAEPAP